MIVDDVCTTGASTIAAIEAAQEAGMTSPPWSASWSAKRPTAVPPWRPLQGAPFLRLFTANEVREEHVRQLAPSRSSIRRKKRADPHIPGLPSGFTM